jgi:hypothetical protein
MEKFEHQHSEVLEEPTEDGLGILLKKKTLYHGSGTPGIARLDKAENDTVGTGIYLTSTPAEAMGYARRRAGRAGENSPVVYELTVENLRMLDLRNEANVKVILNGFKEILQTKLAELNIRYNFAEVIRIIIGSIEEGKVRPGNLRDVTFSTGDMFTKYIESLGYDGLIALEGGEGDDVGEHDTYLIFDPTKVKISKEEAVL